MWPQIIQLLKNQGLTQAKLAELVGVDQATISRLEGGSAPEPRFSVGEGLIKLAGGRDVLAARFPELTVNNLQILPPCHESTAQPATEKVATPSPPPQLPAPEGLPTRQRLLARMPDRRVNGGY